MPHATVYGGPPPGIQSPVKEQWFHARHVKSAASSVHALVHSSALRWQLEPSTGTYTGQEKSTK
jgi:hypothetical protein